MTEERNRFLGEDDYPAAMHSPCRAWIEEHVLEGDICNADGMRLHYYYAVPPDARASVVIAHGLCEFFGKYHELAWYLYREGYAFYFLEQRGHGDSEGKLPEPNADVIHIDDYDSYVKDLYAFVKGVVTPGRKERPLLLFGHSMGGAVSALYLEKYFGTFDAAFLCAPMFRLLAANKYPRPVIGLMRAVTKVFRKKLSLAPGEHHFDPTPAFTEGCGSSRVRYDYIFSQRINDRNKQTCAVTLGWLSASIKAIRNLQRNAAKIRVPVTLFSAGRDSLVDIAGHDSFAAAAPRVKRFAYPASGHEIYNAEEETRKQFFADLFGALEEAAGKKEG